MIGHHTQTVLVPTTPPFHVHEGNVVRYLDVLKTLSRPGDRRRIAQRIGAEVLALARTQQRLGFPLPLRDSRVTELVRRAVAKLPPPEPPTDSLRNYDNRPLLNDPFEIEEAERRRAARNCRSGDQPDDLQDGEDADYVDVD